MYSEASWMGYSECTTPEGVVRPGKRPLRDLDPVEGGTLPEVVAAGRKKKGRVGVSRRSPDPPD
jgi:hypothetical protein